MIVSDCFSESKEANASTTQFQQESPLGQGKHHPHPAHPQIILICDIQQHADLLTTQSLRELDFDLSRTPRVNGRVQLNPP